jgi:hypothetical protein
MNFFQIGHSLLRWGMNICKGIVSAEVSIKIFPQMMKRQKLDAHEVAS